MEKIVASLALAVGIAASGYFIGHSIDKAKSYDRYISVRGLAARDVKSNQAIWQIQFTGANNDLKTLYQQMAKAQKQVTKFLMQQGFAKSAISIQPLSITDNQSNAYRSNNKVDRYTARGGITLSTSKVEAVAKAIQEVGLLVQEGIILSNSQVRYRYTELNTIKPAMLKKATENASIAAQSFAKESHSKIGAIRHASQGLFTIRDATNDYNNGTSIMKKVRVVVNAQYFLASNY